MINRPLTKRRERRVKPGELAVYYAKLRGQDPDVILHNESPARRADAHYMHSVLNTPRFDHRGNPEPSVIEELQSRGYDITTLDFSIHRVKEVPCQ